MKIVTLKEFLNLPAGTVYEQVDDCQAPYGNIKIKGSNSEVLDNDWTECELGGTDCLTTAKFIETLEGFSILSKGETIDQKPIASVPYETNSWGRHGLYPDLEDNTYEFYIYEKDDVIKLIATLVGSLRNVLKVTGERVDLDAHGLEIPFVEDRIQTKILIRQLNNLANHEQERATPKPSGDLIYKGYFPRDRIRALYEIVDQDGLNKAINRDNDFRGRVDGELLLASVSLINPFS